MSIQDIGDDLEAIADDLRQVGLEPGDIAFEPVGQVIERIRVQAVKCRNPRGDFLAYTHTEHPNGERGTHVSEKIELCGIPVRGVQRITWTKGVREKPQVHFSAVARVFIQNVRDGLYLPR